MVKCDDRERRISIYVNGEQKRDYFSVIRKTLRDINASFEKLKTTERVPLPDNPEITVEYEELTGHERMGKTEITIGKLGKDYGVAALLDGIVKAADREKDLAKISRESNDDGLDELTLEAKKKELAKPLNKLGRLLEKLGDKDSKVSKILAGTKKGMELAQKVGRTYNKFAQWLALPQVPDILLGKK